MNRDTRKALGCGGLAAAAIFAILIAWWTWTTVPAGHVGVISTFGRVHDDVIDNGFSFVAPWNGVTKISVQTQEDKEVAQVPTQEGLTIEIEASLLYSLQRDRAAEVLRTIGRNYQEVAVTPQFRSALRGATVRYQAKDLYTAHRSEIEEALFKNVKHLLEERGITCEAVLLRDIKLPQTVRAAVEKKLAAEQEASQMEFTILRETKEAERKRVEAKGIADSQHIIQGTLSNNYLRYLWIKSLEEAAKHQATVVYVPTGTDGMPFFQEAGAFAKPNKAK